MVDGLFLPRPLSAVTSGDVNAKVVWGMYNRREGDYFMPPGLQGAETSGAPPFNNSEASFHMWLRDYLPTFTDGEIQALKRLYPAKGTTTDTLTYNYSFTRAS